MPTLHLTCFQTFTATLDNKTIQFRSVKGRALVAYLVVDQTSPHSRSALAGLLWPDEAEARARRNLTQTLLEVRKAIGDAKSDPPFLQITPRTISFNADSHHQLDIHDFERALAEQNFAQAIDLYTGPFLDDLHVPKSDLFDAWVQATREQLQQRLIDALHQQSIHLEGRNRLDDAIQIVRRLLDLAPWQEEAHCQLMRLLARNGQRSVALAQYDTLSELLMDELGVSPAPETDALYDQILAGEVDALVGSASPAAHPIPFQALAPPPHFVGRKDELARLRTHLNAPGLQIHALVGMGGVGKTTVAARIANTLRADFSDGVLWGNPATSSPLDILATWSSAFGYDFSQMSDIESRAAAVRGLLAEKKALLVVDNVDQLAGIQPLLPTGADCAVLLTTRDLDIAHALNAEVTLLGELAAESALELLEEILGVERVAAEADAAAEICYVLSNLPLAVELTAQRLKSRPRMKLAQMATRLGDQQQRLDLSISDRAVRTSFAVSWDGLDEALQAFFPMLAVFEGRSFRVEAMAYLADVDLFDAEDALYALETLSLVRAEGEKRWWQHPLLADFAREKLVGSESVRHRFADYFYDFAKENVTNFDLLNPEWDNILAAVQSLFEVEAWQRVIGFVNLLARPWQTRARFGDARHGFMLATEAAKSIGDDEQVARGLLYWGEACIEQNDYDEANTHLEKCISFYRQVDERIQIARAQDLLARIAIERNDYDRAKTLLDENLSVYMRANDDSGVASVFFQVARIDYAQANLDAAQQAAMRALGIHTSLNDALEIIRTTRLLAQIFLLKEQYDEATRYCKQAQRLCEELHDNGELAITLFTLTAILRTQQEYELAKACGEKSLALLRQMGNLRVQGALLYQLSNMEQTLGEPDVALSLCLKSVDIFRLLQDSVALAYTLIHLGELFRAASNTIAADGAWAEAKQLGQALNHAALLERVAQIMET